jgi:hypothetical protein
VPISTTNHELLRYALIGLEQQKKDIDAKIAEILQSMEPSAPVAATAKAAAPAASTGGKRTLSAEARARIAAAQRKRWAASRKGAGATAKTPTAKTAAAKAPATKAPATKKRVLSAEARARIAAAQRKRWAAARKGA